MWQFHEKITKKYIDVPWKPDGILYPPTNYPGRENIDADSPFQLRILRFYKIPHFGFFFGVIFGQFFIYFFLDDNMRQFDEKNAETNTREKY